ncbi:MAG: FkbM family methyltransferase [Solirubrobacteraceae bacterium]
MRLSSRPRSAWELLRKRRLRRRLASRALVRAFGRSYPEAFFIEIGANDGNQEDPLLEAIVEHRWRGIMVEPVPYVFNRLKANYGSMSHVALENAAIGTREGMFPFFHLAEVKDHRVARLPRWYDGIGSFELESVLTHREEIPDLAQRLITTTVKTLTFDALLTKHNVERVDLLLIDTEGHDAEVLRSIDLARHRPRLLVYEHFHLDLEDRRECRQQVREAGYELLEEGFDTWCLRTEPSDDLTKRWHALKPALPAWIKGL